MSKSPTELARHALGLDGVRKQSYRNRFVAGEAHPDYEAWMRMVEVGDARREECDGFLGDEKAYLFSLTGKGAQAVLRSGERLDPEDFPDEMMVRPEVADAIALPPQVTTEAMVDAGGTALRNLQYNESRIHPVGGWNEGARIVIQAALSAVPARGGEMERAARECDALADDYSGKVEADPDRADDHARRADACAECAEAIRAITDAAPARLPQDVINLVIAARNVAFDTSGPTSEYLAALDKASEAFADRVPWEDEPEGEKILQTQVSPRRLSGRSPSHRAAAPAGGDGQSQANILLATQLLVEARERCLNKHATYAVDETAWNCIRCGTWGSVDGGVHKPDCFVARVDQLLYFGAAPSPSEPSDGELLMILRTARADLGNASWISAAVNHSESVIEVQLLVAMREAARRAEGK